MISTYSRLYCAAVTRAFQAAVTIQPCIWRSHGPRSCSFVSRCLIFRIRPEAEAAGICRIVPPSGWKPPFTLNTSTLRFQTRCRTCFHAFMYREG